MTTPAYLSTAEAAAHLGMTVGALRMAIHRGHLRPSGRLGKRLLFTKDDLDTQVRGTIVETRPVHFALCAAEVVVDEVDTNQEQDDERSRTEDQAPRGAETWQEQLQGEGDTSVSPNREAHREGKEIGRRDPQRSRRRTASAETSSCRRGGEARRGSDSHRTAKPSGRRHASGRLRGALDRARREDGP